MIEKFYVWRPKWLIPRWWEVAYLIPPPGGWLKEFSEVVEVAPDQGFEKLVTEYLEAYIKEGAKPPDDIAPAIMNMADDFMAGRKMTIRAGDYIALQSHLRGIK